MKDLETAKFGKKIEFPKLLSEIQEFMSANYSALLNTDPTQQRFEKESRIRKYLNDTTYYVEGLSQEQLLDMLYNEMNLFGFLTPYLNFKIKDIEGIEIDSRDSVKIKHVGGEWERSKEHFLSSQHAFDVMKRLLDQSGITMDNSKPLARGHLGDKIRITVIGGGGVLDKDVGIAASIRFVNPSNLTADDIIGLGTASQEMIDFLCTTYRYGISMMLSGETDAGKTTLMSIIMKNSVPDDKKLITIENGTREFNLVKRENGQVINSVVHLVTRDSTNKEHAITQQMLLETAMTMNPDALCMAEVKGSEAYETIEASLTGHPVIGTTHTYGAEGIPSRLVQLAALKGTTLSDDTLYTLAVNAFPILFFAQKCEDGTRRIMKICECMLKNNRPVFNTLWEFVTLNNRVVNGKPVIDGYFKKTGVISEQLQDRLRRKGIPDERLEQILKMEGDRVNAAHRVDRIPAHGGVNTDSFGTVAV